MHGGNKLYACSFSEAHHASFRAITKQVVKAINEQKVATVGEAVALFQEIAQKTFDPIS